APNANQLPSRNPWPRPRPKPPRAATAAALASPHDVVAGKKLGDFLLRRVGSIRAVHRILAERFRMDLPNRSGSCLGRVGRAHDLAISRDGVLTLEHLDDHGSGGHEFDELAEERPFAMDRIEGFCLLAADARAPLRDDTQARALDHGVDRTGQVAGGGIGFDDRKGTLDRHGIVLKGGNGRGGDGGGLWRPCPGAAGRDEGAGDRARLFGTSQMATRGGASRADGTKNDRRRRPCPRLPLPRGSGTRFYRGALEPDGSLARHTGRMWRAHPTKTRRDP